MAWTGQPVSLEYDDDEILDRIMPAMMEPAPYPYGCRFDMDEDDLKEAAGETGSPGEVMKFSAMAEVTSVFQGVSNCRVELQIQQFAGDDGKFFDIKAMPDGAKDDETWRRFGCICLCDAELRKMDVDADCELGDTIHLIGEARLESVSRTEKGGDVASLQIISLSCEDESSESREG